jgi:citrate lyase subunit beta/citryl-CoA lyase
LNPSVSLTLARTLLFVPGDRPDRFGKAESSGADGIILDLEDAVSPTNKDAARAHVASWLARGSSPTIRINAPGTPWFDDDLTAIGHGECTVMLPKASVAGVAAVVAALGADCRVAVLLETAAGIMEATSICRAPNVVRAAFGSIDLCTEIGAEPDDHEALLFARSTVVLASAAAAIAPPLDGVTTNLADPDRAEADARSAARLGFGGKLCIHPAQVASVNAAFDPSDDEVTWARTVLIAADDGATAVDGHMIDAPVRERARRILTRYELRTPPAVNDRGS